MRKELDLNELNTVAGGVVIKPGMPFIPPFKPTPIKRIETKELMGIIRDHLWPKDGPKPVIPITPKPFPKPIPFNPIIIKE